MSTREHGLRFIRRCPHDQTTTLGRTGPLGNPQREKRCLLCGRTLDIREVPDRE